jgi:hypothetical protein
MQAGTAKRQLLHLMGFVTFGMHHIYPKPLELPLGGKRTHPHELRATK